MDPYLPADLPYVVDRNPRASLLVGLMSILKVEQVPAESVDDHHLYGCFDHRRYSYGCSSRSAQFAARLARCPTRRQSFRFSRHTARPRWAPQAAIRSVRRGLVLGGGRLNPTHWLPALPRRDGRLAKGAAHTMSSAFESQ